jgi:drug/metabolite transporter (DMT)-like permease
MIWILIASLSPILHGFANILDSYLTNKVFKNIWVLIFYGYLLDLFFLPLIWLIAKPGFPPFKFIPFILLVGLIEVFYLYPYYKSLENDDTSVVASLFSLGKIFIPILAYFFVGEVLQISQYLGFSLIILASTFLTLKHNFHVRLNRSFFYMLFCSLLLSLEAVIYKHIFNNIDWSTGFFWSQIFAFLSITVFLVTSKSLPIVLEEVGNLKKWLPIFTLERLSTIIGNMAGTYAIALVPVTFGKSIDSTQPFFVLLYALLLKKIWPSIFKETTDLNSILKKLVLFLIMLVGILLVVI